MLGVMVVRAKGSRMQRIGRRLHRRWKKIILLPSNLNNTPKPKASCLVVMLPGFAKGPEAYVDFAKKLQARVENGPREHGGGATSGDGSIAMHLAVGSFCNGMPGLLGTEEVADILSLVQKKVEQAGLTYDKLYVCGHSAGAQIAFQSAFKYDGFIQLGATFNSKGRLRWPGRSLASFPRPTLTIVGELDGFVRYVSLADELEDIDSDNVKMSPEDLAREKAVVVLPEVNHMQLADGIVSAIALKTGRNDLPSHLTIDEAQDRYADVMADFLTANTCQNKDQDQQATQRMLQSATQTREKLSTFRELSERANLDGFLQNVQRSIGNLDKAADDVKQQQQARVNVMWHNDKMDFTYSKPRILPDGEIEVHVYPDSKRCISLGPSSQLSPTLSVKFKSQEAILSHKSFSDLSGGNLASLEQPSAVELNRRLFESVLASVPKAERERYLRDGKQLDFLDDKTDWKTGPDWVDAPIEIVPITDGGNDSNDHDASSSKKVGVRSPVLKTPMQGIPARFAGMCYMKLLSPAQAYEWIVFDSFK